MRSLGRTDEAFVIQNGLVQDRRDGYVFEELGELHLVMGKPDVAAEWFAKACEELARDPWLSANEPERLNRIKRLADH